MKSKAIQNLETISINDRWETPKDLLFNKIKELKFQIKIDVFASDKNHKFPTYFTRSNSALKKNLLQDSFANPPYETIAECVEFLYNQHLKNNINILLLTFAKTDTKWWHNFVEKKAEVHFIQGRIQFLLDGILPQNCKNKKCKNKKKIVLQNNNKCKFCGETLIKNSAPYPSCWIIYRRK